MVYHIRFFADETDYAAMRKLLADTYAQHGPYIYLTLGDLDWWRYTRADPNLTGVIPLWFADEELVGFAWPAEGNLDMVSAPDHQAVEIDMLAWAELNCPAPAGPDGPTQLRMWSLTGDHPRRQLLELSGYTRGDDFYTFFAYNLARSLPQPQLPSGYTLRHVATAEDIEPRVEVHRAAFAPSRMTVAKHQAVMASPTYRPELDIVVTAPDSSFAAYCIVWYDPGNQIGLFEPVGVHPAQQRRGLGRAMMYAGLNKLKLLGAHTAHVLSLRDDSPGGLLYRAAGFQAIDRFEGWIKQFPG